MASSASVSPSSASLISASSSASTASTSAGVDAPARIAAASCSHCGSGSAIRLCHSRIHARRRTSFCSISARLCPGSRPLSSMATMAVIDESAASMAILGGSASWETTAAFCETASMATMTVFGGSASRATTAALCETASTATMAVFGELKKTTGPPAFMSPFCVPPQFACHGLRTTPQFVSKKGVAAIQRAVLKPTGQRAAGAKRKRGKPKAKRK